LQGHDELIHDIGRNISTRLKVRPQSKGVRSGYRASQANGMQIVMEERPSPTVQRVTGHSESRTAFLPRADSAKVLPGRIHQENIRTMPDAHCLSLQSPGALGEFS
jgi:hypothetical protein